MGDDPLSRLRAIGSYFERGEVPESPSLILECTLERVDLRNPENLRALDTLMARWNDVLPSLDTCRLRIFAPAFAGMRTCPAAVSAGLVVTIPAASEGRISVGWAERRWRSDGKLAAKIRMSAFFDGAGKLAWEFGVAGRSPPLMRSLRAGINAAVPLAASYGATLDLTPSNNKAAWLSLRLGGRPADLAAYFKALKAGQWEVIKTERLLYTNCRQQEVVPYAT